MRSAWLAALAAFVLRVSAVAYLGVGPHTIMEEGYIETLACFASGQGLMMPTPDSYQQFNGFPQLTSVVTYLKELDARGQSVGGQNAYPPSTKGWRPSTLHPPGYTFPQLMLYKLFNYRGMILGMHGLQAIADAAACIFIFVFGRNLFNAEVGRVAAWAFAFMPAAVLVCAELLPDGFHCMFTALVLALASTAMHGRPWLLIPTGIAIGVACMFRTEYLLMGLPLFLMIWAARGRFWSSLAWTAGMGLGMLIALLPWAFWTWQVLGTPKLATTGGGGQLYVGLGEDTGNPWGIHSDELWLSEDARRRGFPVYYTLEGDRTYKKLFGEYVRQYPLRYARLVLVHRLPLALAAPFMTSYRADYQGFNFRKYHLEEGLSRWGVLSKYPGQFVKYMWKYLVMAAVSGTLTLLLIGVVIARWRDWRRMIWLLLPWGYTVGMMSLVKQIEPRNVVSILVVECVAIGVIGAHWAAKRRGTPVSATFTPWPPGAVAAQT